MGRATRRELLLSSMKESTRDSLYIIQDKLLDIDYCSKLNVYLTNTGSIRKIRKIITKNCREDRCSPLTYWNHIFLSIMLWFTLFGIVFVILLWDNMKFSRHVVLNLHYNNKNRDHVTQLSRYLTEHYDPHYSLSVILTQE